MKMKKDKSINCLWLGLMLLTLLLSGCIDSSKDIPDSTTDGRADLLGMYDQVRTVTYSQYKEMICPEMSPSSRSMPNSLLEYLTNMSDEQLDSMAMALSAQCGVSEEEYENAYDRALDSLATFGTDVEISRCISITNDYCLEGGNSPEKLVSRVTGLNPQLQKITISACASFDAVAGDFIKIGENDAQHPERMTCLGKLALDLGGAVFIGALDTAMGGAGDEFGAIWGIAADVSYVIEACAKYKWCRRTGVYL